MFYTGNLFLKDEMTAGLNPQEVFYKSIVASGPGSILVLDINTLQVVFCNDHFEQTFGYPGEEMFDKNFLEGIFGELQIERLRAHFTTVSNNLDARNKYFIYKLKGKNGNICPYYGYLTPVKDAENEVTQKLQLLLLPDLSNWPVPFTSFDTRELFLEQFNNVGFGTFEWIIDVDKVSWSDGVYRIYEVDKTVKDLSFEYMSRFYHPDDRGEISSAMQNALERGEDIDIEYKILTEKQHVKVIHAIARTIVNEQGKPIKIIGSIRDITEQRNIEQDIKKHVSELNRSNRELEEFAYIASHDLQEPLRKISTFSNRLQEKYADVLKDEGAMYIERVMASAENMRVLINSLLEFSRIAKSTQAFTSVNLNFILMQVKTDLELIIEETSTSIIAGKLPYILGSPSQIKQLFCNIINNAIKFRNPDVKPVLQIKSNVLDIEEKLQHNLLQDVNYIKLQFSDNGIGFEMEYAQRIFQIFQRLHGKTEYPGSGIGLAICKKIIDHHNGVIYAVSEPGVGATFNIILPETI